MAVRKASVVKARGMGIRPRTAHGIPRSTGRKSARKTRRG